MESDNQFFYANGLELAVSPFDITLKFLRQGAPEGAAAGVDLQPKRIAELSVAMSPGHAKAMLAGLYTSIMEYEQKVGEIAVPSETQEKFNETFGPLFKK